MIRDPRKDRGGRWGQQPRNGGHWLVRQSANGGTAGPRSTTSATERGRERGTAVTATATTAVGGWHNESPQNWYHWVTRGSTSQGSNWAISTDVGPNAYSAGVTALDTDPSGAIYAWATTSTAAASIGRSPAAVGSTT